MEGGGCSRCSLHGPNTHCPCHHNPFGANTAHPAFKQIPKIIPSISFRPLLPVHAFAPGALSWDSAAEWEMNGGNQQTDRSSLRLGEVCILYEAIPASDLGPINRCNILRIGSRPDVHA